VRSRRERKKRKSLLTFFEILHQSMRIYNSRLRTPQGADYALSHIRLDLSHLISSEPFERYVSNPIFVQSLRPLKQFVEVLLLFARLREYEFASLSKRDRMLFASSVEEVATSDAECSFERGWRIVDSGVYHFAVPT
jgi:hypothetical protein